MAEAFASEAELVRRACKGDTEAFAELVGRHQDYIYNAVTHTWWAAAPTPRT